MNRLKRYLIWGCIGALWATQAQAYWIWTPNSGKWTNPKNSVKDSPREQFEWAKTFFDEGDFKRAVREFRKLAEEYPKSSYAPEALYFAAESMLSMKKYYDAYLAYQKVMDKYPGTGRVLSIVEKEMQIANYFFHKEPVGIGKIEIPKDYERCITIYEQVVRNAPFGEHADRAQFFLAESYRLNGQFDQAIEAYNVLLDKYSNSPYGPEARYKIALSSSGASLDKAYTDEEREKALKKFEEFAEKNGHVPRIDEARKEMAELERKNAQEMFDVAMHYEKIGKYPAAKMYYEDLVQKHPDLDVSQEATKRIELLAKKI